MPLKDPEPVVDSVGAEAADGSKLTVNVPSSGRIPNGATVERAVPSTLAQGEAIILNLNSPDFTTATRLADSVNTGVAPGIATIIDGGSISTAAAFNPTSDTAYALFANPAYGYSSYPDPNSASATPPHRETVPTRQVALQESAASA